MQLRFLSVILVSALSSFGLQHDKPAFTVFTPKGKASSYKQMLKSCESADIVLFGELHNNPICHWLELELSQDLYAKKGDQLVLAAEMFEADNQTALDSFLSGLYDAKSFAKAARFWPNYKTDYQPLVQFALDKHLSFIAANIPRRYASLVYKRGFEGLDSLSTLEKSWMAPLPIAYDSTLPGYRDMMRAMGGHAGPTLPMAQAVKDATMAHFIYKNWGQGKQVLHYNGSYHSNNHEGIVWYLKQLNPNLKIVTIGSTEQSQTEKLEKEQYGAADFILVIPENMTKTY